MRELIGSRLLGVGLAAALAAVTVALWLAGRLSLYINPDSTWFAVSMALVVLVGAAASFALPRGAEADHGRGAETDHDHGDGDGTRRGRGHAARSAGRAAPSTARTAGSATATRHFHVHAHTGSGRLSAAATVAGGILATGVVAAIVLTPPATLSAELAMQRDTGAPPLFQGADTVALASSADTSSFGVGEWATVFATATNPDAFDGAAITLTGFVTPAADGFALTRLVITHCVIDAQPASIPIAADESFDTGQWVRVTGTIRSDGGALSVHATGIDVVDQPGDPYEY